MIGPTPAVIPPPLILDGQDDHDGMETEQVTDRVPAAPPVSGIGAGTTSTSSSTAPTAAAAPVASLVPLQPLHLTLTLAAPQQTILQSQPQLPSDSQPSTTGTIAGNVLGTASSITSTIAAAAAAVVTAIVAPRMTSPNTERDSVMETDGVGALSLWRKSSSIIAGSTQARSPFLAPPISAAHGQGQGAGAVGASVGLNSTLAMPRSLSSSSLSHYGLSSEHRVSLNDFLLLSVIGKGRSARVFFSSFLIVHPSQLLFHWTALSPVFCLFVLLSCLSLFVFFCFYLGSPL